VNVKNANLNIILLWVQSLLLLAILIFVWNLKSGQSNAFAFILAGIILNFIVLILFAFSLKSKIILWKKKNVNEAEVSSEQNENDENQRIQREYVDPKSVAERIFKNTMLKRTLNSFGEKILQNLAPEFEIMQGIIYLFNDKDNKYHPRSFYAIIDQENVKAFSSGEGLPGQAVTEEKISSLSNLPDDYRQIKSGLGKLDPNFLYFLPLINDKKCLALIEISTLKEIPESRLNILNFLISLGAKKLIQFREKINE